LKSSIHVQQPLKPHRLIGESDIDVETGGVDIIDGGGETGSTRKKKKAEKDSSSVLVWNLLNPCPTSSRLRTLRVDDLLYCSGSRCTSGAVLRFSLLLLSLLALLLLGLFLGDVPFP
jgi:hypothetical protein